jgi:hypothetical protein
MSTDTKQGKTGETKRRRALDKNSLRELDATFYEKQEAMNEIRSIYSTKVSHRSAMSKS